MVVNMGSRIIFRPFPNAKPYIVFYNNIFRHNRFVQLAAALYAGIVHDNRIPYHGACSDGYAAANYGIVYLAINVRAFADNTALHHTVRRYILGRQNLTVGVNLPVFFIEIKLRNNVYQFHVGFPIRIQRAYVLPVAVKLIRVQRLSLAMAVRNHMLAKIERRLFCHRD